MSNSQTVNRNRNQHNRARKLLWPVAVAIFLFRVSYPANDFAPPPSPPDIGLGMLLVYAGIAAVTVGVVFAGVLPWALRRESSGGVALALAILGTLLAPGFGSGSLPDSPPVVRCSAGPESTRRGAAGSRKPRS